MRTVCPINTHILSHNTCHGHIRATYMLVWNDKQTRGLITSWLKKKKLAQKVGRPWPPRPLRLRRPWPLVMPTPKIPQSWYRHSQAQSTVYSTSAFSLSHLSHGSSIGQLNFRSLITRTATKSLIGTILLHWHAESVCNLNPFCPVTSYDTVTFVCISRKCGIGERGKCTCRVQTAWPCLGLA